jgi:glutathione S-transferase
MIELIQFPWSPFCIVQRRILEYSGAKFRIVNIPNTDRSLVWKVSKGRYYEVPIVRDLTRDRSSVIFETSGDSQVIAKYLDDRFRLGLFPRELDGLQSILWRYIENDIEGFTFKLDDIYWRELVPKSEHLNFVRHKERRFGRGCLDQWREQQSELLAGLERGLLPCEQMLIGKSFLLGNRPHFVDFDLFGMLGNFLFTGHYVLPGDHKRLQKWYKRMGAVRFVRSK